MWGVDNTYLSRVVDEDVFDPYEADGLEQHRRRVASARAKERGNTGRLRRRVRQLRHRLVRRERHRTTGRPRVAGRARVRRPARRPEPGLVLAWFGVPDGDGRRVRRRRLDRATGSASSTTAWRSSTAGRRRTTSASAAPATDRKPLVVSYGTSPPVEVMFADPPIDEATTAVLVETCFRQVEFAGVLSGTDAPDEARRLVDFLISEPFQAEIALNLFVYPGAPGVELPTRVHRLLGRPRRSLHARPGDDRRAPRRLDRHLDRHRPAMRHVPGKCRQTRSLRSARSALRVNRLPRWFVPALAAVPSSSSPCSTRWPLVTVLARGLEPSDPRRHARRLRHVGRGVVHAVAGRCVDGPDDHRRPGPCLRHRPLRVPGPAGPRQRPRRRVRAADRGHRRRRPRAVAVVDRAGGDRDRRRPRLVQPGSSRAYRRDRPGNAAP